MKVEQRVVERDDIRCPVRVPATEFAPSHRCWHHTGNSGICPAHGNVTEQLRKYSRTRALTEETELPKPKPPKPADPSLFDMLKETTIKWIRRKLNPVQTPKR